MSKQVIELSKLIMGEDGLVDLMNPQAGEGIHDDYKELVSMMPKLRTDADKGLACTKFAQKYGLIFIGFDLKTKMPKFHKIG